jgi:ubiquinone/menaquinone biosynthesis C-methylase UbiE
MAVSNMSNFDKHFYDFIYGTIHHHDYADNRANELIRMYGKVRFLELGAGCGILVKALQDKGCESYGIEISDYAVSERCTDHLIKGDARKIPFPDNSFDVVHSWAMFGYNSEEDTEKIIKECKRIGKNQYHSMDSQIASIPHMQGHYPYGYVFMKPKEWWDERIKNEG